MFDSLILNPDRHYDNWGFMIGDKGFEDLVILDNEYAFIPRARREMKFSDSSFSHDDDLFEFLNTSSDYNPELSVYYMELFSSMYDILTPEVVSEAFNAVEEENNMTIVLKDIFVKNYTKNYQTIGDRLKGLGL